VEGGGLTVSGVSRNRGGFVKCVAIQKRLGIPVLEYSFYNNNNNNNNAINKRTVNQETGYGLNGLCSIPVEGLGCVSITYQWAPSSGINMRGVWSWSFTSFKCHGLKMRVTSATTPHTNFNTLYLVGYLQLFTITGISCSELLLETVACVYNSNLAICRSSIINADDFSVVYLTMLLITQIIQRPIIE
jgi:hypothetical protein